LAELGLELSNSVLQLDDIVAVDLATLGCIQIFANRSRPFAGQAAR
jgi:hypothetical protein